MATAQGDSTPYGGGAGGKLPKKLSRRRPQTTPYDRPPTVLRASNKNNIGGWFSRISDPASKLISATARKLFSSLSRKRLLSSPHEKVQLSENYTRDVTTEDSSRIQVRDTNEGNTRINGSPTNENVQLELILKTNTFTKSEMDHLTALMHSRTVDETGNSGEGGCKGTKHSKLSSGDFSRENNSGTLYEHRLNPSKVPSTYVTPSKRLKVCFDDVASPAELAKIYMGSRSTKVYPSREQTLAHSSFQLQRPTIATVKKSLNTVETSQNDFVIPRSHDRSAIYNKACTPYFRASGVSNDASHVRHVQSWSSQKVLKRRFSVLEHDIGSVGPIRRARIKSNLAHPKSLQLPSFRTPIPHATPSKAAEASLYYYSKSQGGGGDNSLAVGEKIFMQLERMTPPKVKFSAEKSGAIGGMSAMEQTPAVLQGQAHKSSETGGSVSLLQRNQVNGKNLNPHAAAISKVQDYSPRKLNSVHDSSSKGLMSASCKVNAEKTEAEISDNNIRAVAKTACPLISNPTHDVAKKSQVVDIASHKDCLELEASHMHSSSNMLLENSSSPEAAKTDKPAFPEIEPSLNSVSSKNIPANSLTSADNVSTKRNGFSAPPCQPAMGSQTYIPDNVNGSTTTTSFGLKKSDETTPFISFPPSVVDSSTSKDVESQCSSSVFTFAADATEAALKLPDAKYKTPKAVNMYKQSDNTTSLLPVSTTSTPFKIPGTSTGNINSLSSCPATSAAPPPVLFPSQSASSSTFAQSNYNVLTTPAINASVAAEELGVAANSCVAATNNISSSDSSGSVSMPSFRSGPKSTTSLAPGFIGQETSGSETAINSKDTTHGRVTGRNSSSAASASTHSQLQASDNVSNIISGQHVLPAATAESAPPRMPIQPALTDSSYKMATSPPFAINSSPASVFRFVSAASLPAPTTIQPSQPGEPGSSFSNGSYLFSFTATSPPSAIHSNQQMSMDVTMAEVTMQPLAPAPVSSTFGLTPASNIFSGMDQAQPRPNPFQLGTEQNQYTATQNPFQDSGGFGDGTFSLGSGDNDKSHRRILKVRRRFGKK